MNNKSSIGLTQIDAVRGEEANTWSFRKTLNVLYSECERCTVPVRDKRFCDQVMYSARKNERSNEEMRCLRKSYSILILRVGVAFAFIYPAIAGFVNPNNWIGYFPSYIRGYIPDTTLLLIFGIIEILLALLILFLKNIRIPAIIASLMLAGIIISDFSQFDVIFRDVPILALTIMLAIESEKIKI